MLQYAAAIYNTNPAIVKGQDQCPWRSILAWLNVDQLHPRLELEFSNAAKSEQIVESQRWLVGILNKSFIIIDNESC